MSGILEQRGNDDDDNDGDDHDDEGDDDCNDCDDDDDDDDCDNTSHCVWWQLSDNAQETGGQETQAGNISEKYKTQIQQIQK